MLNLPPLDPSLLPPGPRARIVPGVNGLDIHVIEAGHETPDRPLLLLLHGFPEIGYSWRKLIAPLAAAGYHVVAPDQRGYGRTTGWEPRDGEPPGHGLLDWVRDCVALVGALGHRDAALVGHDFGAQVAGSAALIRPDLFRALVLMSSPFAGAPELVIRRDDGAAPPTPAAAGVHRDLSALAEPRKHYQWYYSEPSADAEMSNAPQGVHAFLRAYFHVKSADWIGNAPFPLTAWSAAELAKLPTYYVMRRDETMPETVAYEMPSAAQIAACSWLTEAELRVYSEAYEHAGFDGALQFYRGRTAGRDARDLATFAGRRIDVPACFVSGRQDWGPHQKAGDLQRMRQACPQMGEPRWIDGAGHWVQQEQPQECLRQLLDFLGSTPPR